jgi:ribosome-associated protein
MDFQLKEGQEFIQLNNLLQVLQFAQTGGHSKILIKNEEVKVNGTIELQVRKKIRKGDIVEVADKAVKIN